MTGEVIRTLFVAVARLVDAGQNYAHDAWPLLRLVLWLVRVIVRYSQPCADREGSELDQVSLSVMRTYGAYSLVVCGLSGKVSSLVNLECNLCLTIHSVQDGRVCPGSVFSST